MIYESWLPTRNSNRDYVTVGDPSYSSLYGYQSSPYSSSPPLDGYYTPSNSAAINTALPPSNAYGCNASSYSPQYLQSQFPKSCNSSQPQYQQPSCGQSFYPTSLMMINPTDADYGGGGGVNQDRAPPPAYNPQYDPTSGFLISNPPAAAAAPAYNPQFDPNNNNSNALLPVGYAISNGQTMYSSSAADGLGPMPPPPPPAPLGHQQICCVYCQAVNAVPMGLHEFECYNCHQFNSQYPMQQYNSQQQQQQLMQPSASGPLMDDYTNEHHSHHGHHHHNHHNQHHHLHHHHHLGAGAVAALGIGAEILLIGALLAL